MERRPLSGTAQASSIDGDPFQERSEEAVVSKEARVTEELVIRKEVEERTETVSDTVRRTEVEVDDERGTQAGLPPLTGSKAQVSLDRRGGPYAEEAHP